MRCFFSLRVSDFAIRLFRPSRRTKKSGGEALGGARQLRFRKPG
jgi:hypothetical protein